MSAKRPFIGRSVLRLEDPPLVRGQGRFAADISFPGQLHMRVVRSPYAHAILSHVDVSAAADFPGVVAAWSGRDVADVPPIDFRLTKVPGLSPYRQPILAQDRVRYVGEPVAVVFAEDPYAAEDAAELVTIEVQEAAPLMHADAAVGEFRPGETTEPTIVEKQYGDLDEAFRAADQIVALDLKIGRHSGVPLEPRGAVASYDEAGDMLRMYGAAKVPHWNRGQIARMLGRPVESVHLHEGHVGGGFGVRGELYPEDVLVCLAALRLRRPVKWIEDRRENLLATNHSREQRHRIRAAIDADGRILAVDNEFFHDQGAYVRTHGATVPDLAAAMLPGPYRIPAYRARGHLRLTNKTPGGTYRAPGRFESTFVRERLLDAIASHAGIDRIEVRRRNLIRSDEMPFARALDTLGTNVVLDSGDYEKLLAKALGAFGWEAAQKGVRDRRAKGELVGLGLGYFVEKTGLGPSDCVRMEVQQGGAVEVVTGAASVGQGVETVVAQIAADTLGVDYGQMSVIHGQTDRIAFGMGAFASRVTVMTGEATRLAAVELRAKVLSAASVLMQRPAEALDMVDGQVVERDRPGGPSMSLAEVARLLPQNSPDLGDRPLSAEAWFHSDHMNYPYGVHLAQVRVDEDTGGVTVERYLVGYDVGRAVNPMLIEGQIQGGFVQGLGGALFEEFLYDERGEPLSVTFADYLMPTAREAPDVTVLITEDAPSPLNPLGLKGAGEGGTNAVGAALASAIDDAIGMPGAITQLPVTPQRLYALLRRRAAQGAKSGELAQ